MSLYQKCGNLGHQYWIDIWAHIYQTYLKKSWYSNHVNIGSLKWGNKIPIFGYSQFTTLVVLLKLTSASEATKYHTLLGYHETNFGHIIATSDNCLS